MRRVKPSWAVGSTDVSLVCIPVAAAVDPKGANRASSPPSRFWSGNGSLSARGRRQSRRPHSGADDRSGVFHGRRPVGAKVGADWPGASSLAAPAHRKESHHEHREQQTALAQLSEHGQSVWIDYLSRDLLDSGELAQMIEQDAVLGITSTRRSFRRRSHRATATTSS
jgi:hypothetical protein